LPDIPPVVSLVLFSFQLACPVIFFQLLSACTSLCPDSQPGSQQSPSQGKREVTRKATDPVSSLARLGVQGRYGFERSEGKRAYVRCLLIQRPGVDEDNLVSTKAAASLKLPLKSGGAVRAPGQSCRQLRRDQPETRSGELLDSNARRVLAV